MKYIFTILFSLILFVGYSQQQQLYRSYGYTVQKVFGKENDQYSYFKIGVSVTRTNYQNQTKQQNESYGELKQLFKYKYRYEIYIDNQSLLRGVRSPISMYGVKILVDGVEITKNLFPNGIDITVGSEKQIIWWIETNNELNSFYVSWTGLYIY